MPTQFRRTGLRIKQQAISQAEGREVVAGSIEPSPQSCAATLCGVVRGSAITAEQALPARHIRTSAGEKHVQRRIARAWRSHIAPIDEAPTEAIVDAVRAFGGVEGGHHAFDCGQQFSQQRAVTGQLDITHATAHPLQRIGGDAQAVGRAQARDQAVGRGVLGSLHQRSAHECEIMPRHRGDLHRRHHVARPLATFAQWRIDQRVLGAGAHRLDANTPDPFKQRIAAGERSLRCAEPAAFIPRRVNHAALAEHVDFQKAATAWFEW